MCHTGENLSTERCQERMKTELLLVLRLKDEDEVPKAGEVQGLLRKLDVAKCRFQGKRISR